MCPYHKIKNSHIVITSYSIHYTKLYDAKKEVGNRYADIVYEGKWFTPLREAYQAFIDVTQEYVTGEVKLSYNFV